MRFAGARRSDGEGGGKDVLRCVGDAELAEGVCVEGVRVIKAGKAMKQMLAVVELLSGESWRRERTSWSLGKSM